MTNKRRLCFSVGDCRYLSKARRYTNISYLSTDYIGGGRSVATIFTILGGSFDELWPFFCRTEGPRDYPEFMTRSFLPPELAVAKYLVEVERWALNTLSTSVIYSIFGWENCDFCARTPYVTSAGRPVHRKRTEELGRRRQG